MNPCQVSGCHQASTTYSNLCASHREQDRRHGDPRQTVVRKSDLSGYIKTCKKYIKDRAGPNADKIITKAWRATVFWAEEFANNAYRGRPCNKYELQAAELILEINKEHQPMDIALVLMGMGYFYEDQPRRWASQKGFIHQTVRMFQKLGPSTALYKWASEGKMIRSSYPRIPKRRVAYIWAALEQTKMVGWGVSMAREVEKTRELKRRDTIAETAEILGPLSSHAKEDTVSLA